MKLVSTALLAAGLVALSACGGTSTANNTADANAIDDTYNVAPDDLGGNLADNTLDANLADANAVATNVADTNATNTQ